MIDFCNVYLPCTQDQAYVVLNQLANHVSSLPTNGHWHIVSDVKNGANYTNHGSSLPIITIQGNAISSPMLRKPIDVTIIVGYSNYIANSLTRGAVTVRNIISPQVPSLGILPYNSLLGIFMEQVVCPAALHSYASGGWIFTSQERHAVDYMENECAGLFEIFAGSANKYSAASHPSDQQCWFEFIVSCSRQQGDKVASAETIRRLLLEDYSWEYNSAVQLALEYEFGLSLLKYTYGYRN